MDAGLAQPEAARIAVAWMESRLHEAVAETESLFAEFRLSEALMATYKLVWDDFCSVYLELAKPAYGQPIDAVTHAATGRLFAELLKLLHPFMPFISEEIWHWIAERNSAADDLCIAPWPVAGTPDAGLLADFAFAQRIIAEVRTVRNDNRIAPKEPLVLHVIPGADYPARMEAVVRHLAFLGEVRTAEEKVPGSFGFVVGTSSFYVPFHADIDVEAERAKLNKDIAHLEGFIRGVNGKLSNAQFVANAPAAVVELERKKAADAAAKLDVLRAKLAEWG